MVATDHLPPFDNEEYQEDVRNRNRELKQQIDPDTQEPVILLTKRQLEEMKDHIAKGLGRF